MENWKMYELQAHSFLVNNFKSKPVTFVRKGGSNSMDSDIDIINKGKSIGTIEAKLSPAQAGQIVLIYQGDELILSPQMRFENNYAREILKHINENKTLYFSNSKTYADLYGNDEIIFNWIKEHYKNKGSEFIITSVALNSFHSIVPIEKLNEHFKSKATIRRKQSGTRDVPNMHFSKTKDVIEKHLCSLGATNVKFYQKGKTTLVNFDLKRQLDNSEMYTENLFLSETEDRKTFRIKVRATTNNINVVFSLTYVGEPKNGGLKELNRYIDEKLS